MLALENKIKYPQEVTQRLEGITYQLPPEVNPADTYKEGFLKGMEVGLEFALWLSEYKVTIQGQKILTLEDAVVAFNYYMKNSLISPK